MPRKQPTILRCLEQGCDRRVESLGLCSRHYQALKRDLNRARGLTSTGKPKAKPPTTTEVRADYAYPDTHPQAPGGQRIAVYTCPQCAKPHQVAWLPFDPDPGLKQATCLMKGSGRGPENVQFLVAAPAPENVLTRKPAEGEKPIPVEPSVRDEGVSRKPSLTL
jgi:hypothetical protein